MVRVRHRGTLFSALLIGACLLIASGNAYSKIKEGQEAIRFTGTNFITNQPVDLSEHLKKKVILLDFGSIYCSSCMVTVPNLIKLSKEYSEDQLAIFNIYLDIYNPQRVTKFFLGFAKDLRFSLLIDNKLQISREYGVDTLPTTMVIDKSGVVRKVVVGYTESDEKEINKLLDDLIREIPTGGAEVSAAEQNLQLFTPESFTKTTAEALFVVGYLGGAGTKEVTVKLNNLPERVTKTKDNIFHFRSNLSLAMNLIEVKGQVEEGKVKTESMVVFREPKLGMEIKSELPAYRFHMDDDKKQCVKCHKLALTPKEKETQQASQICLQCHKSLTKQIYVHGPISVGGCLPCHDYTSYPMKYELRTTGPNLCFTCHENMKEMFNRSQLHGPAAAGVCTVCHDPHGSAEKYLLRRKMDQMCISCHQDTLRDYAKNFLHTPVKEGNCAGCHDPHSSNFRFFLRREPDNICSMCHMIGTYQHMHREGDTPAKAFPQEETPPPLSPGGTTICTTCHLVHSSDYAKLVRGAKEDFCAKLCH